VEYLGSMITNTARCTRWFKYDRDKLWLVYTQIVPVIFEQPCIYEIKYRIVTAKAAHNRKKNLFASKLGFNLRKKLEKYYIWNTALYDPETWTLRKVDQKYLTSF
jgi:hypothetical protein